MLIFKYQMKINKLYFKKKEQIIGIKLISRVSRLWYILKFNIVCTKPYPKPTFSFSFHFALVLCRLE